VLYVAATCPMCSPLGSWLQTRNPKGLTVVPAELAPAPVSRALYVPASGGQSSGYTGVAAIAKALEHLNAGWALAGWTLLLPGVKQLLQLLLDAVGAGPRTLDPDFPLSHLNFRIRPPQTEERIRI
jgi:hypothetical protein